MNYIPAGSTENLGRPTSTRNPRSKRMLVTVEDNNNNNNYNIAAEFVLKDQVGEGRPVRK